MYGLEILDVAIGLMFVYLLLALLATAIHEYLSAVMNRRGKELARGIGRLLEDAEAADAVKRALRGVDSRLAPNAASLTERFYAHPLIRPLATRRGRLIQRFVREPRLPSYIPARTFAMAVLDVLGYREPFAGDPASAPGSRAAELVEVIRLLKRESPVEVSELRGMLEKLNLPEDAVARLVEASIGVQSRLQRLHDSVEVWFNNAMDRVSGAYRRSVQGWLLGIGVVLAAATNADTLQMWRQLAGSDDLARAMAERAAATLPALDSAPLLPAGPPLPVDEARDRYLSARARLDSMELSLGWTRGEAVRLGLMKAGPAFGGARPAPWYRNAGLLGKLVGLAATALAISLGAPFWFDVLNKVVSVRAAGRAPAERPKPPEGEDKRLAGHTPR
jgi:hypothetical protein